MTDENPNDVIRTKRVEIVDDNGTVRASLGLSDQNNVYLSMSDTSGTRRVLMSATANFCGLRLNMSDSTETLSMIVQYDGPIISFSDANGVSRMKMHMSEGYPVISLVRPDGMNIFQIELLPDGTARIQGHGKDHNDHIWPL